MFNRRREDKVKRDGCSCCCNPSRIIVSKINSIGITNPELVQYFKNKGDWHDRSSGYVPKRGDVIFFGADRHTGLVDHSENGVVYTIEGNSTNGAVCRKSYNMSYGDINGYGSPKYK